MTKRADRRFGDRAFRYASSGRTSSLKSLVDSWKAAAHSLGSQAPSDVDLIVSQELALLRDRKGRNLLHLGAKSGDSSMIHYLLTMGLPSQSTDAKGNSVAHWLLKCYLKRQSRAQDKASKKAKRKPLPEVGELVPFYTECCQLLRLLVIGRTEALTTQNDEGQCPTDLLQRLWNSASTDDRAAGDKILMTLMSCEDTAPTACLRDSPCGDNTDNLSPFGWTPGVGSIGDGYAWEDYFSGFSDRDCRSHLETIAEEFERRKNAHFVGPSKAKLPGELPQSSFEEAPSDFYRRHERALLERSQVRQAKHPLLQSYEQFRDEWHRFASNTKPICKLSDIAWPPVCGRITSGESRTVVAEMRINLVLNFVDRSTSVLRKLQIDWHPDRFLSRFGERFDNDAIKDLIVERVNALSQLFNTSVDALRNETGDALK